MGAFECYPRLFVAVPFGLDRCDDELVRDPGDGSAKGPAGVQSPPARADLSWSAVSDDATGIAGFRVYRNGGYYAWSDTTAFSDTSVAPATAYAYTVYAQDGAGNLSAVSNKVTVTTP